MPSSLGRILQNAIGAHAEEVEAIEGAHAQEIAERERALEIYHATIHQVEERYKEDSQNLTLSKRREIKKIISANQDDPDALAARISEYTGFPVIVPED